MLMHPLLGSAIFPPHKIQGHMSVNSKKIKELYWSWIRKYQRPLSSLPIQNTEETTKLEGLVTSSRSRNDDTSLTMLWHSFYVTLITIFH